MTVHLIDRTSPKGTRFRGTCRRCGATNLPFEAAQERCPWPATPEQNVLDAIARDRTGRERDTSTSSEGSP